MVDTVDAHAKIPQKRKRCPDGASTEPWSVAKSDMTVTSDMGRWEKADLDDSQNEELLTEELEDMLDEAYGAPYGRRPTPTPTPSPPSWVAPLQEDQDSQVLADLPKPANPREAVSINSPEATTSRNVENGLVTVGQVTSLIEKHFGVELPDTHVGVNPCLRLYKRKPSIT